MQRCDLALKVEQTGLSQSLDVALGLCDTTSMSLTMLRMCRTFLLHLITEHLGWMVESS